MTTNQNCLKTTFKYGQFQEQQLLIGLNSEWQSKKIQSNCRATIYMNDQNLEQSLFGNPHEIVPQNLQNFEIPL